MQSEERKRSKGQRKAETKEDIYNICVCMYVCIHTHMEHIHTYVKQKPDCLKGRNSKRWRWGEEKEGMGSNKNKITETYETYENITIKAVTV